MTEWFDDETAVTMRDQALVCSWCPPVFVCVLSMQLIGTTGFLTATGT